MSDLCGEIDQWIDQILWTRWGWRGYMEDGCDVGYRNAEEKRRIRSAVVFVLRALGNNRSAETQAVVDSIVDRRSTQKV